ncbi:MAG: CoA transferase [Dehalococcoidales bacterium]|nr:CoA transferase [Dehalococcoidales bacterium]
MTEGMLSGYRALDLTDEKGFVCGKILASTGVEVIKIEIPGGDPARNIPLFYQDVQDPENSLYWKAFNTGKKSITLDIETRKGQELFRKLVEKVDFVIESFTPGYMADAGIGYEALSQLNPRIIMTSITSFGQKGPYSHYKSCNLVACAMGGVLSLNGDPDRSPVKEALDSVYFEAGAAGALGTVMAHYYRETTGEGQQVDISLQECCASRNTTGIAVWQFDKRLLGRTGNKSLVGGHRPSRWLWPCKDGYLFWTLRGGSMGARINPVMSRWFDETELENPFHLIENPSRIDMAGLSDEILDTFELQIGKLFLKHTKKEIMDRALTADIQAWILSTPADVLENQNLKERNFWIAPEIDTIGTRLDYPGHFFLSNTTDNTIKCPAPMAGEHNTEIYGGLLGYSSDEIAEFRESQII